MTFDFDDPRYYDVTAVWKELERVTELCAGCCWCYRLCTPFDFMRPCGQVARPQFARKAADAMEAARPDVFATDCSLSALQIEEASGRKPVHPIALLREAHGIPEEH